MTAMKNARKFVIPFVCQSSSLNIYENWTTGGVHYSLGNWLGLGGKNLSSEQIATWSHNY